MEISNVRLAEPSESLRQAYLDFMADFAAAGQTLSKSRQPAQGESFAQFVQRLNDAPTATNLPPHLVPGTMWWLMDGDVVVGVFQLRHWLTPALEAYGGHIGYVVAPSHRRKGYATRGLELVLDECRRMGLDRVLITCNKDNIASARVIQKCGGVLENEGVDPSDGMPTQRYWIELAPAGLGFWVQNGEDDRQI